MLSYLYISSGQQCPAPYRTTLFLNDVLSQNSLSTAQYIPFLLRSPLILYGMNNSSEFDA